MITYINISYRFQQKEPVLFHLMAYPTHTQTAFADKTEQIFKIKIYN